MQKNYAFQYPSHDLHLMIILKTTDDAGQPVTILNGYFPQGENEKHETKYPAKRKFYKDLMTYLDENHTPEDNVIVMGDVNISHTDLDIGIGEENRKRWLRTGKCSFLPEEREWLNTLFSWGFEDSFRTLNPETNERFSWFDYRSKGFNDNRGLRIDLILAAPTLFFEDGFPESEGPKVFWHCPSSPFHTARIELLLSTSSDTLKKNTKTTFTTKTSQELCFIALMK